MSTKSRKRKQGIYILKKHMGSWYCEALVKDIKRTLRRMHNRPKTIRGKMNDFRVYAEDV
jgi:hypothetical protein